MENHNTCVVSFTDAMGIRHSAEVSASTLYEAAVLGVNALRTSEWVEGVPRSLEIEVRPPVVRHQVSLQRVKDWLHVQGRSPREIILKQRLLELMGEAGRVS